MKEIYEKMGLFYLGKNGKDEGLTLYKSKDLTTHAMLIGMTGSGKTGLGITLIEEAAIDNIPSIIIDPKGDMTNLCLSFDSLSPAAFEPWLENPKDAQKVATMWREGLEASHQDAQRVKHFSSVKKTIYTPGSSAGVSVNILGSFEVPPEETLQDSDALGASINASVASLLALLSIEADPIASKEHLLLSTIFSYYYERGVSLSFEAIIGHIVSPPFEKVGLFSLETFYPQEERMKLAMRFNSVIASVSFASWIEGEALDIGNMLYDSEGNAKIAIFTLSHLGDNERMFFVTLLLNAYINWMRRQRGSTTLKNILYMDEIFGFFPPSKNPPSKEPMLLLLKQARAFGSGIVLSTQNPVDLDYKGLSNIGTWFVGKLQTKQDIEKVLEPLLAKSKLTKEEIAHKLATLKSREFFLKNVHSDETVEFFVRWVISYLKGPMTKDDIKLLMQTQKDFKELKKESPPQNSSLVDKKLLTYSCEALKMKSTLSQTQEEFFIDVKNRLKELKEQKIEKLKNTHTKELDRLESKLSALEIKLEKERSDVSSKTTQTLIDVGLSVLSVFFGRKTLSVTNLRRGASVVKKGQGIIKERSDVESVEAMMQDVSNSINAIQEELLLEIEKLEEEFDIKHYEIKSNAI